jgi:hypothetical protein
MYYSATANSGATPDGDAQQYWSWQYMHRLLQEAFSETSLCVALLLHVNQFLAPQAQKS